MREEKRKVREKILTAFINKSRKEILVIKKKTFEVYLLFDTDKFMRILKARFIGGETEFCEH